MTRSYSTAPPRPELSMSSESSQASLDSKLTGGLNAAWTPANKAEEARIKASAGLPARHPPRPIEMRNLEFTKVSSLDLIHSLFNCELFIQFAFAGGAHDEDLCALEQNDDGTFIFPMGENGDPTWRPSAGWYMDQLDANNGVDWIIRDKEVMFSGDDLLLKIRIKGIFYQQDFNLYAFPFDVQQLNVDLCFNCRTTGNTPVQLVLPESSQLLLNKDAFMLHNEYNLLQLDQQEREGAGKERVSAIIHDAGSSASRMFPSIKLSLYVQRRPSFHLINVALPMAVFAALAFLQWEIPPDQIATRAGITLTLVLTAAAFKFGVSSMVPSLAYLTLLDEYVFVAWFFIILCTGVGAYGRKWAHWHAALVDDSMEDVGSVDEEGETMVVSRFRLLKGSKPRVGSKHPSEEYDEEEVDDLLYFDNTMYWAMVGAFILMHLFFLYRINQLQLAKRKLLGDSLKKLTNLRTTQFPNPKRGIMHQASAAVGAMLTKARHVSVDVAGNVSAAMRRMRAPEPNAAMH